MRLGRWFYCLLFTGACLAQEASGRPPQISTVRGHGESVVSVRPDQVKIDIGVVSQAQTAQAAGAQNAKQVADVLASLKQMLGPTAEIQTIGYSLTPNYRYAKDGGNPSITGYTATNMVQVKSADLASIGKVIDAATKTGANNINGIQFMLKDEQAARGEALKQAALNARANAEAMAAGLGLKIGKLVSIEHGQPVQVYPVRQMEMMRAAQASADVPTSIESGSIQIRATVTVTAELLPR